MIWGLDAQATLGPVSVAGEYASASIDEGSAYDESILFVQADAMFDILGGVDFSANYRDIAPNWEANLGSGGALTDADDYTFAEDQSGFGAELGFGLFIFDVGAYFDMLQRSTRARKRWPSVSTPARTCSAPSA